MIGKYFTHGEKEISLDTLRNYFPVNKSGKLIDRLAEIFDVSVPAMTFRLTNLNILY